MFNRTGTDTNGFGASAQATYRAEIFGRPNRTTRSAGGDAAWTGSAPSGLDDGDGG